MTAFHGSKAVFKIQDSAGALQAITAYTNHVTLEATKSADESTAEGAVSKSFVGGYSESKIHLDGVADAALDNILRPLLALTKSTARRNFEYGPQGQSSGLMQITGQCILLTYQIITKHDQAAVWMAELQVSGDVASGVY